jgi:hypothetical protein
MMLSLRRLAARPSIALPVFSLAAMAAAGSGCAPRRSGPPADLIIFNGKVVTMDPAKAEAQAVAVRGGTIAAVGANEEILALAGDATRRIDAGGGMVLPGLIDAHGHIASLGSQIASLDLRGVASLDEVTRRVRDRAAQLSPGEWVTGGGWDQNLWPGEQFPDHRPLTEAAPDRPVWLSRIDGHAMWANRKAMDLAGISRATPDPSGGEIVRDAKGDPTGIFVDNASELIGRVVPPPSRDRLKSSILLALQRCAAAGLTEVHDAGVSAEEVAAYKEMADAGQLPLRVYLMWSGMGMGSAAALDQALAEPQLVNHKDRVTLRSVKLMIDGAMGSRGAVFFADYDDDQGNRGLFVMQPEAVEEYARVALKRGYQVNTHAIGDRGIRLTLDAYEKALAAHPSPDPRPRIEHLQCIAKDDVPRLKSLGVIASMQPSHATSDMYWADERVGTERGQGLYAWRWVIESGALIAAGSDFPVDPEKPLIGIHSALTRQDLKHWPEEGWHPEQKMTLDEVLRAYTVNAAYAGYEEKVKGRLVPGLWADLTVLAKDLRAIPPQEIPDVAVTHTIVGGSVVHETR